MKRLYILLNIILIFTLSSSGESKPQQTTDDFKSGSELYSEGKYQEALDKWMNLYKSGYLSSELNYNIGNAYFKMQDVPGSILFYERALLLEPADEDIIYNLQIARSMAVDKFKEIPELFFVTWFNFIALSINSNAWAVYGLASFILFLLMLSLYLYSKNYRLKIIGFWLAVAMIFISLLSLSLSARNKNLVFRSDKAIIMVPQVNGKSSPDQSGTDLFLLHEGTKVTIGDKVGEWHEIRLSDCNKGWLPSNSFEKL